MNYTLKPGMKEFFCAIAGGIVLMMFYALISNIFKTTIISDIIIIIFAAIFLYFIYTRYCPSFSFTIKQEGLLAERQLKNKSFSTYLSFDEIKKVSRKKPKAEYNKKIVYTNRIINSKNKIYVFSSVKGLLIEIEGDEIFLNKLKEHCNG